MNKTTTFLSLTAIATLAGFALSTGLNTSASEVDIGATAATSAPEQMQWFGRGFGKHAWFASVKAAIEANDYSAFQTAVADTPFAAQITTQEQFDSFVKIHTLREEGKMDEAKSLATELGLPEMKWKGMHGDFAKMDSVKTAISTNNYTAFQTAIAEHANSSLASIDTAEEFAKLVQMHSLLEEAKAIAEELGLPWPHGAEKMKNWEKWGKGFGKFMR